MIVDLVAVTVTLHDVICAVNLAHFGAGLEHAFLCAEPHAAAQVRTRVAVLDSSIALLPFGDQRDHRVRRIGVEFGAVRAFETDHIASVLDYRELHAEADAE